uniref:Secreted protein n=1 Tax=Arundo donax TaxID=35708 RepID=A0A0A8YD27_ARUDO
MLFCSISSINLISVIGVVAVVVDELHNKEVLALMTTTESFVAVKAQVLAATICHLLRSQVLEDAACRRRVGGRRTNSIGAAACGALRSCAAPYSLGNRKCRVATRSVERQCRGCSFVDLCQDIGTALVSTGQAHGSLHVIQA